MHFLGPIFNVKLLESLTFEIFHAVLVNPLIRHKPIQYDEPKVRTNASPVNVYAANPYITYILVANMRKPLRAVCVVIFYGRIRTGFVRLFLYF